MKSSLYFTIATILFLGLTGCEEENDTPSDVIKGTGPVVTKTLELSSFKKIELTGTANFYIKIGSPQSVVLSAQQNIIDAMTWSVTDQSLKVGLKPGVSVEVHDEIRFDITLPEINRIFLSGVGNFELSGADQSELSVSITGVGDIKAYEMKVNRYNIVITGVGNCQINVISNLIASITGVGNIYYKGYPTISSTITGLGQIVNSN